MIGTHDSYTYLKARNRVYEWFSFLWRTQSKSIEQQKEAGVTYFDIRVYRDYAHLGWRVCHGIVDFDIIFDSLENILTEFPTYKVRIILERGGDIEEVWFAKDIEKVKDFTNLSFACIKKDWKVLIDRDPAIIDYTYTPWLSSLSFWENIKRFNFFSTIKRWAKRHNPIIGRGLVNSEVVHFMDYV